MKLVNRNGEGVEMQIRITHPISGEVKNQKQWAEALGLSTRALSKRMADFFPKNRPPSKQELLKVLAPRQKPKRKKPVIKLTHPQTKETKTIEEWAAFLHFSERTIRDRIRRYGIKNAGIILAPSWAAIHFRDTATGETHSKSGWAKRGIAIDKILSSDNYETISNSAIAKTREGSAKTWTEEEDFLLSIIYQQPGFKKAYRTTAKSKGWRHRTDRAISLRLGHLREQGLIGERNGYDAGSQWITVNHLAACLGVSRHNISRMERNGLQISRSGAETAKINLHNFVIWACSPSGSSIIVEVIPHQNYFLWLLVQIGNWYAKSPRAPI